MTVGGVHFDLKITFILIVCTILPMLDWYQHRIFALKAYDRIVLYLVIPLAIILLLFRESPAAYGFQLGNWREGLLWVLGVSVAMTAILWFVARDPAMVAYYSGRVADSSVGRIIYVNGVDLLGWEFIWRGFMLFGLARVLGPGPAIFISAIPFAFMHLNKPELETLTTIFGGAGFAFIAWRTNSFVYPWLIHWSIANVTMLIASGRVG